MQLTSALPAYEQWALMDEVSDTVAYYGFPVTSASETDPLCAIMKVEKDGAVTTRRWSNGSMAQNVQWSDRGTLTYKFL